MNKKKMPKHPKYHRKKTRHHRRHQQDSDRQGGTLPSSAIDRTNGTIYEEPEMPSWTKKEDVVDYLSEDDTIPNQAYACISMLSLSKWRTGQQRQEAIEFICNKEGYDIDLATKIIDSWSEYAEPKRALKIRGVWGTYQEAKKRSEFIQRTHKNHNVAVTSVGYWVPFDPDPDKVSDQNYMERELNDLKEGYMRNREKGKEHFEEQKALKAHRARIEGSKWGQEQMLKRKETRQEVEHRIESAKEDIAQYTDKIKRAQSVMEQAEKKLDYMEEHPEIVLEEEDTPVDVENVPSEVLEEIKQRKIEHEKDDNKAMLLEIEKQRKPFKLPQQAPVADAPPQPDGAVTEITKNNGPLNDELILPHQARQAIKEHDEQQSQSQETQEKKTKII